MVCGGHNFGFVDPGPPKQPMILNMGINNMKWVASHIDSIARSRLILLRVKDMLPLKLNTSIGCSMILPRGSVIP